MKAFLLLILLWTLGSFCFSQPILLPGRGEINVTTDINYKPDSSAQLTISTLQNTVAEGQWKPIYASALKSEAEVYWIKFSVTNKESFDGEWILSFDNWGYVDFYYSQGGQVLLKKTGYMLPYRKRDYPRANHNYIRLLVKSGETITCTVRLQRGLSLDKIPQDLSFQAAPRAVVDERYAHQAMVIFTFLGILAVMFFYNLFIYTSTRLAIYKYYLPVLFFPFYFTAGNSGYLFTLLPQLESLPLLYTYFNMVASNFYGVFYLLFVQVFFNLEQRYPRWNKVLNFFNIVYLIAAVFIFVYREISFQITQFVGLITIVLVIYVGIKSIRDNYPAAIYFVLGNTALLLGIFCVILTLAGVLPKNEFTYYFSLPTGSTIEVTMFSFALANMIRVLRRENEEKQQRIIEHLRENQSLQTKVNRELEQKVQERTQEINVQKEQILTQKKAIEQEKEKADQLLLNILPEFTAQELKEKGFATPRQFQNVSVLFTDFVGFTEISEELGPDRIVADLDYCFRAFDDIIARHNLEKIKTIGDAYMAAAGVPIADGQSAQNTLLAALEIRKFIEQWKEEKTVLGEPAWELRIGIHTGPVTAGVVGKKKFAFDIWGETVNQASRMESGGIPGKINISGTTYDLLKDRFPFTYRGKIAVKHNRLIDMYLLDLN